MDEEKKEEVTVEQKPAEAVAETKKTSFTQEQRTQDKTKITAKCLIWQLQGRLRL